MAWYLVFHIIGIIIWMGALLDLTRFLGYHVKENFEVQARLSWIEYRVFFFVATPGLVITLLTGIMLIEAGGGFATYFAKKWFLAKFVFVLLLIGSHIVMGRAILALKQKPQNANPARFKAMHGITALIMIFVIILVLVKPF